ncbi:MAG: hypothetical protein EVG15_04895 [Candidatus Acididesulfobacter diazotrophicus]|uniref:Uncharacterized protein n=1 Tax=Candidatus Acididesulfobacter diazotrophicus TaxID=2597226 RepID=A0A519BN60_9DELT|nr:MAG: hypothetical protein EVG15_04895 [Candidatus Acididesulfobacter diazotrophicus]
MSRNGMRFYLRNFPVFAGVTLMDFKSSPVRCHSCESGNPVLLIIKISLIVSIAGLRLNLAIE